MENNTEPNQTPNSSSFDAKTTGWVAYLTFIGLIIAFCAGDREGAKFHLNQALVITLAFIDGSIVSCIPFIGLIAAINQEEKEVPLLGQIKILK